MKHFYVGLLDGAEGAYGIVFPDLPGCTAAGATLRDVAADAAEAIREWTLDFLSDGCSEIPSPRDAATLEAVDDVAEELRRGALLVLIAAPIGADEKTGEGGVQNLGGSLCEGGPLYPVDSSEGDEVRGEFERQQGGGLSSSDPDAGSGSSRTLNAAVGVARSPAPQDRSDAVRFPRGDRPDIGRAAPIPNPPRGLAALQAHARVNTIFDTYQTRQGPVGDLIWSTLPRLALENTREAALLRLIYEHGTPGNPNARVRDILKLEDLQRMIQKAAEIANA